MDGPFNSSFPQSKSLHLMCVVLHQSLIYYPFFHCVSRAHEIQICPLSVVGPSSVSQLSLNSKRGIISTFICCLLRAIRMDTYTPPSNYVGFSQTVNCLIFIFIFRSFGAFPIFGNFASGKWHIIERKRVKIETPC